MVLPKSPWIYNCNSLYLIGHLFIQIKGRQKNEPDRWGGHPNDLRVVRQARLEEPHEGVDVRLELLDPVRTPTVDVPECLERKTGWHLCWHGRETNTKGRAIPRIWDFQQNK